MKKSLLSLSCLCLLTIATTPAMASDQGPYLGLNAGVMIAEDSTLKFNAGDYNATYNTGFTTAIVGGYKFPYGARLEAEVSGKSVTADTVAAPGKIAKAYDSTLSAVSMLTSAYYDIAPAAVLGVTPYIGGGVGFSYLMLSDSYVPNGLFAKKSNGIAFAYQVGAGATYNITPKVTADIGYRYFGTSDVEFDGPSALNPTVKLALNSHNIIVGARYNF